MVERTVQARNLHGACDYTPFEGMPLKGWPVMTLVRGEIVVSDEQLLVESGGGNFLPREPYAIGY
jgi:dihydropyrimidinase